MICRPFEVVVVPFPFSDKPVSKRRPALVISGEGFNRSGHTVLAMITSQGHPPWPGDVMLEDLRAAGLSAPSMVRLKLFTLDNRFLLKKAGLISARDAKRVQRAWMPFLAAFSPEGKRAG